MYLEDTILHSLKRVSATLAIEMNSLEMKILESTDKIDTTRLLVRLEEVLVKKESVQQQINARIAELQKPKSFWEKLFRK